MADKKKKSSGNLFTPFAKIPKSLVSIKHIVKDPIKNPTEADERKQEVLALLYFGIILLIGCFVLCCIPATNSVGTILAMIPVVFLMFSGFLLFVVNKAKKRFKDLECPKCKKIADAETKYTYEIVKRELKFTDKGKASDKEPTKKVKIEASEYITFNVTFVCSDCGATKTFIHTSRVMTCHKGGISILDPSIGNMNVPTYEAQYRAEIQSLYNEDPSMGVGEIRPMKSSEVPKSPNAKNGIVVTYNRSIDSILAGYFNGTELN